MSPKAAPAKKALPRREPTAAARSATKTKAKPPASKKRVRAVTYADMRALALSLDLPGVVEATSWGQPTLKTFGKVWFYWSPKENAPVFKVSMEERDFLIEADPDVFFTTDHHRNFPLVLARPDRVDLDWARAKLLRVWRAQAPKKALKTYDEARGAE